MADITLHALPPSHPCLTAEVAMKLCPRLGLEQDET